MKRRCIALILALVMLLVMASGCQTKSETPATETDSQQPVPNESQTVTQDQPPVDAPPVDAPADAAVPDPTSLDLTDEYATLNAVRQVPTNNSYPIEGETHNFKMWTPFQNQNGIVNGYDDLPFVARLEELTNVHIEFSESPNSSASEQFNLIIVSNEYPDLFRNFSAWYTNGVTAAYEEEVIIDMTDLIADHMPRYTYCLDLHDTDITNVTDENGMMLYVSAVVQYEAIASGSSIRSDWLDAVGLDIPHTVDELEEVLLAFKGELGIDAPLDINSGNYTSSMLTTAYDSMGAAFYQIDNKVVFGATTDNFKEYLKTMSKWYELGLFSNDFMSITDNPRDPIFTEMLTTGQTGVFNGRAADWASYVSGNVDSNASYAAMKPVVLNEGELNNFYDTPRTVNNGTIAISTQCSDPVTAAIWMDYMFGYEGAVLLNYGIEGESFNYVDGNPVFDYDYIAEFAVEHNWENTRFAGALYYNPVGDWFGLRMYMIDPSTTQDVRDAWDIWNDPSIYSDKIYRLPFTLSYTLDETERRSTLITDINTYISETVAKFITGEKSLEAEWQTYIDTIEGMNIKEVVAIDQAAYDRYLSK